MLVEGRPGWSFNLIIPLRSSPLPKGHLQVGDTRAQSVVDRIQQLSMERERF